MISLALFKILEKTVEIQFKNRYLSNIIGNILFGVILVIIFIYIYAAWFEKWDYEQNFIFVISILFAIAIAGSLSYYRTFEKATFNFIPEGIIIKSRLGYIPIKYDEIKYFKGNGIPDSEDNTVEFVIETKRNKKYRIKSKFEIYEGLIEIFPNKDGKYVFN